MKTYNPLTNQTIESKPSKTIKFLYYTKVGRCFLKLLTMPWLSKVFGWLTKTKLSTIFIKPFVKKNNINLSEYPKVKYTSFNDFFTRKIKETARPIEGDKKTLVSPSDSKITAYKITDELTFSLKNSTYSIKSLLRNEKYAKKFIGGTCLICRLCVDDYHRYMHIDDGKLITNWTIKGILHTVNPLATDKLPVYIENHREISILKTKIFQEIAYIEVGALNVGKINNNTKHTFRRGDEKGYFSFGASTIIILFQKDTVVIDKIIIDNTQKDIETIYKQGQQIGHKK